MNHLLFMKVKVDRWSLIWHIIGPKRLSQKGLPSFPRLIFFSWACIAIDPIFLKRTIIIKMFQYNITWNWYSIFLIIFCESRVYSQIKVPIW